eukprot:Seg3882.1 transcript_id=Seg3882.1/GoldUCD/mRNA.D3Y31 product="hypothetical protein" protein_id=Seg3882.1/GoldUCD/D3Y31
MHQFKGTSWVFWLPHRTKKDGLIDVDRALTYPLAHVPLSLATSDGCRWKTTNSKLLEAAFSSIVSDEAYPTQAEIYVLDLAAPVCSIGKVPDTFRELSTLILTRIPVTFREVYVACDTYQESYIKNAEHQSRGDANEFVIRNADIRIPADFKRFLANGNNKERLFELLEQVCEEEIQSYQRDCVVYFARKQNRINVDLFSYALRELLIKGRGKWRNLMIVGPANCGKTFLL